MDSSVIRHPSPGSAGVRVTATSGFLGAESCEPQRGLVLRAGRRGWGVSFLGVRLRRCGLRAAERAAARCDSARCTSADRPGGHPTHGRRRGSHERRTATASHPAHRGRPGARVSGLLSQEEPHGLPAPQPRAVLGPAGARGHVRRPGPRRCVRGSASSGHPSTDVVLDSEPAPGCWPSWLPVPARSVHAVEHSSIIDVAERVAKANDLSTIVFHHMYSASLHLEEPVDVLVHEQMGNALFEERRVTNVADLRSPPPQARWRPSCRAPSSSSSNRSRSKSRTPCRSSGSRTSRDRLHGPA